ncbi:hypothetical protein HHI36_005147, partial [Cryptolaemus montrouzieri]
ESSVCTVSTENTKVFAKPGRKHVARITLAKRGVTTTAVIYMSASGTFVPPMFTFRRIRMKIELMEKVPTGAELDQEEAELQEPPSPCVRSDNDLMNEDPPQSERSASPDTQQLLATNDAELDLESPTAQKLLRGL